MPSDRPDILIYEKPEDRKTGRQAAGRTSTEDTRKDSMQKNVIVIGAGAAGLMAAAAAAEQGSKVTVLEKNEKAGKKIYITGKGRCNLTNDCATEEFFGYVARNHKFLYSAVYGFDHEMVKDFFEKNGCPVKVERGGRVFPVSDHASDVTAALLRRLQKSGVRIMYHTTVSAILTQAPSWEKGPADAGSGPAQETETAVSKKKKGRLTQSGMVRGVRLQNGQELPADAVIVCTGGLSYPSTGSDGSGLKMARQLGLEVTPTAPSLVPFETREIWCRDLQGLALKNVSVSIFPNEDDTGEEGGAAEVETPDGAQGRKKKKSRSKKPVYQAFGELLFTHFGLSGPIILTASCYCDFSKYPGGFRLYLNLKPALSQEQLEERLHREFEKAPDRHLPGAVRPLFPARLAEVVTQLSGLDPRRRAASFTEAEIRALAALIQALPVTVTGTRGYSEAIITRGGISVREFDPSTMESRRISGLFAAGEVLDVDAQTGGFNLQIAWSTGRLAGLNAGAETGSDT